MNKKILLVLGASSDIGISFITKYESDYDYIIAHYYSSQTRLAEIKDELGDKIELCNADFSNEIHTKDFVNDFKKKGKIPTHIVNFTAQKVENKKFSKIQWEDFQRGINIQLRSTVIILKEFLPIMSKNKYGKIVFILSSYTNNNPPKYLSDYISIKYALLGLMKSLAIEYADKMININAISPSMVETKFLDKVPQLMIEQNAINSPLKRNAKTEDILPFIQFLLSDETGYMTGQNLFVTGGTVI